MTTQVSASVQHFDHSVLPCMDLFKEERFYTEVLGGAMFLKPGMTHHDPSGFSEATGKTHPPGTFIKFGRHHLGFFLQYEVPVYPAAEPGSGYPCWGLWVAEDDFDDVVQAARDFPVPVGEVRTEGHAGIPMRSVFLLDPDGNSLELVSDPRGRYDDYKVTGISHMHTEAVDLAATSEFYGRYLGLEAVGADEEAEVVALGMPSGQHLFVHRVDEVSPATVGPYFGRHCAYYVEADAYHVLEGHLNDDKVEQIDMVPGLRRPGELDTYFFDPSGLYIQIKDMDSLTMAKGWPRYRYVTV